MKLRNWWDAGRVQGIIAANVAQRLLHSFPVSQFWASSGQQLQVGPVLVMCLLAVKALGGPSVHFLVLSVSWPVGRVLHLSDADIQNMCN